MKLVFPVVLLFFSVAVVGQRSFTPTHCVSFRLGPNVGYRSITNPTDADLPDAVFRTFEDEVPATGFEAGLGYDHRIASRWWLATGLSFCRTGYQHERDFILGTDHDGRGGVIPGRIVGGGGRSEYDLLVLPINLRLVLSEGRYRPFIEGGFRAIYQLRARTRFRTEDSSHIFERSAESFHRFRTGMQLGLGLERLLNNRDRLFAMVSANAGLRRVNQNGPLEERLYGLQSGLGYRRSF